MRNRTTVSAGIASIVLGLSSCGVTGQSPKSVENEIGKMVSDSLGVLSPAVSQKVVKSEWSPCSEETPGVHRAEYKRVVDFDVSQADSQKAIDLITAEWKKKGYDLEAQMPDDPRVRADGKDNLVLLLGVEPGGNQMFLTIDSGCVHVSSDPKTG